MARGDKRHEVLKDMTRAAVKALGLNLLVKDEFASPTVTSIASSSKVDVEALRHIVKNRFNLTLAGGQGKLKGKLLRVGHMGWCFPSDIFTAITYLELGLQEMRVKVEPGAGIKAAEEVYVNHA